MKKPTFFAAAGTALFLLAASAGVPAVFAPAACAQQAENAEKFVPAESEKTLDASFRGNDSRATASRAIAQFLAENTRPRFEFRADFSAEEFEKWRLDVKREAAALVFPQTLAGSIPEIAAAAATRDFSKIPAEIVPAPKLISEEARDGYSVRKYECFPLRGAAVPFYVLVPDSASESAPAPAVLCIPGSGQPKEWLVGEGAFRGATRNDFARRFVRAGFVAIAVDNPCVGEAADPANARAGIVDYDDTSRLLLELGWTYQGYAAFVDKCVLDFAKSLPCVRRERVSVAGFSLGTEALMLLGAIDDEIFAFVYNDFLCTTRERALSMTVPASDGCRYFPNSIRHLFPAFYSTFDFPDLVSALAPRPVFCNEGGLDRDFRKVRAAYALAGVPANALCTHQPKFADPAARAVSLEIVPKGLTRAEFFRYANVDPANHYFKSEAAIPWLEAHIRSADAR